ncbi:MAG: hypothetical protein H0Z28_00695 [Archaeoglobus sp.]|nr:hypothetical protein [Archaeoglobus sp.]
MEEKIPGYEEQKVLGDRDTTSEYVEAARAEFRDCVKATFLEIAKKAFYGDGNIAESVMDKATSCWRKYFQSMKGGINITEEDIKKAIRGEEERQRRLYDALATLTVKFREKGFQAEILPPDKHQRDSGWDLGLTAECNLKVDNILFCAFPLIPAKTKTGNFENLRSKLASVVFINEDCVLLLIQPRDKMSEGISEASENFWKANKEFFHEKDVKHDFPDADIAVLKNNFLLLISSKTFTNAELEEIRRRYGVVTIVKGDSSGQGFIYTGKEGDFLRV